MFINRIKHRTTSKSKYKPVVNRSLSVNLNTASGLTYYKYACVYKLKIQDSEPELIQFPLEVWFFKTIYRLYMTCLKQSEIKQRDGLERRQQCSQQCVVSHLSAAVSREASPSLSDDTLESDDVTAILPATSDDLCCRFNLFLARAVT